MQIARNVSADFMVEAVSGYGVEPSTPAIQPVMDYTLGFDSSGGMWNYSAWVPDAVVILIGPNDEVPPASTFSLRRPCPTLTGVSIGKEEGASAG